MLNPNPPARVEKFGSLFAPGDKIMQIENDHDRDVFNGDLGTVLRIDDPRRRAMPSAQEFKPIIGSAARHDDRQTRGGSRVANFCREKLADMYAMLGQRIDAILESAAEQNSLTVALNGLGQLRQTWDSVSRLAGHTPNLHR